jgi:hypothetical protein
MKKIFTLVIAVILFCGFTSAQIICIQCFHQNDSISSGVTNLIKNGSFELGCPDGGYFCGNSVDSNCAVTDWVSSGGGMSTYAHLVDSTWTIVPDGLLALYTGNFYANACPSSAADTPCVISPFTQSCDTSCIVKLGCTVTGLPFGHPINQHPYGGDSALTVSQTVSGLTVGSIYVLEFWVGGESASGYFTNDGIFAINVGFGDTFMICNVTQRGYNNVGTRYIVEFRATSTSHKIQFKNWGHICSSCTEAIFDDVKLYPVSQVSNTVAPCLPTFYASAAPVNAVCNQCNGSATATPLSGVAPYSYSWSNTKTTQTVDSLCPGSYTVTITDSTGATATAAATIINDSTGTGTVNITASSPIMCNGDSSTICADAGYTTYMWSDGDTGRCITVTLAGNYQVSATNSNGCNALSNVATINVYPQPPISVSLNGDSLVVYQGKSWQWYFNGAPLTGDTTPYLLATTPGNYTVQLTDSNGCTTISNTVTITSIENLHAGDIKIYPNPNATGVWQLEVGASMVGNTIQIFNDEGKLIHQSEIKNQKSEINLNAAGGIYTMQIRASGNVIIRKLVRL